MLKFLVSVFLMVSGELITNNEAFETCLGANLPRTEDQSLPISPLLTRTFPGLE